LKNSKNYYPFGMEMAGRGFSGSYRFGYQGSEKDNEVSGDGNSYTEEFYYKLSFTIFCIQ